MQGTAGSIHRGQRKGGPSGTEALGLIKHSGWGGTKSKGNPGRTREKPVEVPPTKEKRPTKPKRTLTKTFMGGLTQLRKFATKRSIAKKKLEGEKEEGGQVVHFKGWRRSRQVGSKMKIRKTRVFVFGLNGGTGGSKLGRGGGLSIRGTGADT